MPAKVCQNCGKGSMTGNNVTRARQDLCYRSSRVFKPNLHKTKIKQEDGTTVSLNLCTKCLRMMKSYMAENSAK